MRRLHTLSRCRSLTLLTLQLWHFLLLNILSDLLSVPTRYQFFGCQFLGFVFSHIFFELLLWVMVTFFQTQFFFAIMNAIDFICLIPFYISMLLEGLEDVEIVGKAGKIIRFLKILRIFRVYKMFKHFAGLQSLLYTLQQAYKELGLLLHIVGIATINLHFCK